MAKETKKDKKDVKVNIVDTRPCSVTLDIEVPHSDVLDETEKVFLQIQQQAQIPGFRAGKAPMDLVKQNYTNTAKEKVIQNLVQKTAFSSLEAKGISPVDHPQISELKFDFDRPFTYKLKSERHPEFKVKDYKGIKIKKEIREIAENRVNETLDSLRERNARLEPSMSEAASEKSYVLVDYQGMVDGKPAGDLNAKNQLIDLSAPQTLAGFKEILVGAKKGDEKESKINFPADHPQKAYAGKDVTFKIKVNDIKEKILPAGDDEFAKDLGLKDLAELKSKIKESLEAEEKKRQDSEVEKQIMEHLASANSFPVPDSLVESQLSSMLERMKNYMKYQGLPESEFEKNIDELRKKYRSEAEKNVKISYIFNAIVAEEKIEAAKEDIDAELERLKGSSQGRPEIAEKYFEKHKDSLISKIKEEKLIRFLLDNGKVKETKGDK
ncbi:MAG: trigger factor [Endomicrobiales bacterium]|nr:trigger factor [Endomicrobiales bacterium]